MGGAVDFLLASDRVRGDGVGVTGFCMGGGLALVLATQRPDAVKACVPWYGLIPWPDAQPDWSALAAPVRGHYAELDGFFGPDKVAALEAQLRDLGKDAELLVYPGVDHAFFNDTRPEVYDAAAADLAWTRTLEFLRAKLG
jgi:carboxymethylenebutenolidase